MLNIIKTKEKKKLFITIIFLAALLILFYFFLVLVITLPNPYQNFPAFSFQMTLAGFIILLIILVMVIFAYIISKID
jgi:membrane protease YdiL (CAAX protease family)